MINVLLTPTKSSVCTIFFEYYSSYYIRKLLNLSTERVWMSAWISETESQRIYDLLIMFIYQKYYLLCLYTKNIDFPLIVKEKSWKNAYIHTIAYISVYKIYLRVIIIYTHVWKLGKFRYTFKEIHVEYTLRENKFLALTLWNFDFVIIQI